MVVGAHGGGRINRVSLSFMKNKALVLLLFLLGIQCSQAVIGTVWEKQGDVLILSTQNPKRPYIALKNYSGPNGTVGKRIEVNSAQTGTYDWSGTPLELYLYPSATPTPQPSSLTRTLPPAQEAAQLEAQIKQMDAQIENLKKLRDEKQKRLEQLRAGGVK